MPYIKLSFSDGTVEYASTNGESRIHVSRHPYPFGLAFSSSGLVSAEYSDGDPPQEITGPVAPVGATGPLGATGPGPGPKPKRKPAAKKPAAKK